MEQVGNYKRIVLGCSVVKVFVRGLAGRLEDLLRIVFDRCERRIWKW